MNNGLYRSTNCTSGVKSNYSRCALSITDLESGDVDTADNDLAVEIEEIEVEKTEEKVKESYREFVEKVCYSTDYTGGLESSDSRAAAILDYKYHDLENENCVALGTEEGAEELSLTWKDLVMATNNFSNANLLKGDYELYSGVLPEFPFLITVLVNREADIRGKDFTMESVLKRERCDLKLCRHPNIVQLLGDSVKFTAGRCLSILEALPGGTLHNLLYADSTRNISWDTRLHILLDVAKGLFYLHEDLQLPGHLIHRNIKPFNIFLAGLTAKIGGFDATILNNTEDEIDEPVTGTMGYMAPECFESYLVTRKQDVYSFGVIVLEVITRKSPLDDQIVSSGGYTSFINRYPDKMIDSTLIPELDCIRESVALLVEVGLQCITRNPEDRPRMKEVVFTLKTMIERRERELKFHLQPQSGFSTEVQTRAEYRNDGIKAFDPLNVRIRLRSDHLGSRKFFRKLFGSVKNRLWSREVPDFQFHISS